MLSGESKDFRWRKIYPMGFSLLLILFLINSVIEMKTRAAGDMALSLAASVFLAFVVVVIFVRPYARIDAEAFYFHIAPIISKKIRIADIRNISLAGNRARLLLTNGQTAMIYLSMVDPLQKEALVEALRSAIEKGSIS
jgi:hypothetical protein